MNKMLNLRLSQLDKNEEFVNLKNLINDLNDKKYFDLIESDYEEILEKHKKRNKMDLNNLNCVAHYTINTNTINDEKHEQLVAVATIPPLVTQSSSELFFDIGSLHKLTNIRFEAALNSVLMHFNLRKNIKVNNWAAQLFAPEVNDKLIPVPRKRGRPPKVQKINDSTINSGAGTITYIMQECDIHIPIDYHKLDIEYEISQIIPLQITLTDNVKERLNELVKRCESKFYLSIKFN